MTKNFLIFWIFLSALMVCGCHRNLLNQNGNAKSTNLENDLKLMWETVPLKNEKGMASSDAGQAAASRVFNTINLIGMTKTQIIKQLGDPKTSNNSIYNFPFYPAPTNSLVYRFDTGGYGWQFNVVFDASNFVEKVERRGIE